MSITADLVTAEVFAGMGDIGACELIEGEIVKMTPAGEEHGEIAATVCILLGAHVRSLNLGKVCTCDTGILMHSDPDTVRTPDVLFVSTEKAGTGQRRRGFLTFPPDLVVEVVSPDDRWVSITEKVAQYLDFGVPLVWVVDPRNEEVRVHETRDRVQIVGRGQELTGGGVVPGFSCKVDEIFD